MRNVYNSRNRTFPILSSKVSSKHAIDWLQLPQPSTTSNHQQFQYIFKSLQAADTELNSDQLLKRDNHTCMHPHLFLLFFFSLLIFSFFWFFFFSGFLKPTHPWYLTCLPNYTGAGVVEYCCIESFKVLGQSN